MSPRTANRLRSAVPVVVTFVLVSITWDFVSSYLRPEMGGPVPATATLIGVLIAIPLILFESSTFAERFRRLSFPAAVLLKTVTYVGALTVIFLGVGLLVGWMKGLTMQDFRDSLPGSFVAITASFVLYLVIIFLRQLDSLLGPGVLLRFVTGRYHQPRRERRIFMFVDIEGSTELSRNLSMEHYYGLVNDFFRDVAGPVQDSRGEIYEYVGDEVVISWEYDTGIRNANCIRAFFEIEKVVWRHSESVPESLWSGTCIQGGPARGRGDRGRNGRLEKSDRVQRGGAERHRTDSGGVQSTRAAAPRVPTARRPDDDSPERYGHGDGDDRPARCRSGRDRGTGLALARPIGPSAHIQGCTASEPVTLEAF